jgi:hypothetical protein
MDDQAVKKLLDRRGYWQAPDGEWWRLTGWWCPICQRPIAEAAYKQFKCHPWCIGQQQKEFHS